MSNLVTNYKIVYRKYHPFNPFPIVLIVPGPSKFLAEVLLLWLNIWMPSLRGVELKDPGKDQAPSHSVSSLQFDNVWRDSDFSSLSFPAGSAPTSSDWDALKQFAFSLGWVQKHLAEWSIISATYEVGQSVHGHCFFFFSWASIIYQMAVDAPPPTGQKTPSEQNQQNSNSDD